MTYDVNVSFSVPAGSEREAFELMTTVLNRAGRCRLMRAENKSIIESSIVSEPIAEGSEVCAVPDCGGFTHAKGANYCEDHKNG